ncbi:imelysin family protein [Urechidicola croceus]|uniref:Peptidase M75 superfamily protein n=1 Tax=Urechidicola croceus TaxID=1850246 RepID=A0A1D8P9Z9_9FLAO|nr:imelysin family protein [Urechidicola croceus]AOW21321.1 peptidase M75 superfamily protein [Urechidicola croceus]
MIKKLITLLTISLIILACSSSSDEDSGGEMPDNNFDRTALLSNIADNIIIPAFQDLQTEISILDVARGNFINDMSQSNLDALSTAWLNAYKTWQHVEMFNLGEAENLGGGAFGFVSFFNIYPVTVADIENGAATGNYDLNTPNYHDAQGFPALDFLIHGVVTGDTNPIDKFTTNTNADGYVTYITNVIAQIQTLNNRILNNWENTYRDTFVGDTSNGLNSSLNKLVNDFIFYYEKGFRANKFGIPAGNFSNETLPEKVEAFYKQDISKELAIEGLQAIENLFNGRAYGSNATGESFKTYLEFLERDDIVTSINDQLAIVRTEINNLDDNFYQQIMSDNIQMTTTYDVIQTVVPLLKIDMAQAFNVTIDFVDADGD